jgi:preprotein translocase subunit YajC
VSISSLFIATAQAQEGGAADGPGGLGMFMPMILVFLIFYFLLIRPQQKQQKKQRALIAAIQKGDEVVTASGIYGKVISVAEKTFVLEIGENTRIKIDRPQIARLQSEASVEQKKK